MFNIKLWRYTKFAHNYSSHSVARCHYSACNRSTALVCASSPFNPYGGAKSSKIPTLEPVVLVARIEQICGRSPNLGNDSRLRFTG
jgi:hypothetical protein